MGGIEQGQAVAKLGEIFGCGEDVSLAMYARASRADYPPRAVIVGLGARCEHVHIVLGGLARARAISADGRQAVLEDFRAGDLIGETSLVEVKDSDHEVVAVELVESAVVLAHVMVAMMTMHADVALAISRRIIARLAAQNRRLAESSTLSAAGRIHAELLRLARAGDGMTIRPAPVLSQMAMHLQTTRETVSRTISALERRGIVRRDAHALTVVAEHRLEDLVY